MNRKQQMKLGLVLLGISFWLGFMPQEDNTQNLFLDLYYRSLQPGEVVKVSLPALPRIKLVSLRFLDKKIKMVKRDAQGIWLAFVGLDLSLTPGTYPLQASILYSDGSQRTLKQSLVIGAKEFPQKKLWVDEKFVTPPAEALERIRREAELISSVFAIYSTDWLGKGNFAIPAEGKVNPNFGERRIFNNKPRSPHSGIDISSPWGAPVKASNSGKVVLANDLYYAGKTVILDHGLGVFSFYCHFSKIKVKRGSLVAKGDIIGDIGATGRVTGPHLHWSVRVSGSRIDPFSLLYLELN